MGDIIKLPGMAESAESMLRDLLARAESGEIKDVMIIAVPKDGGLIPLWSPNHAANVVLAGHVLIDYAMTVLREGTAPGFEKVAERPEAAPQSKFVEPWSHPSAMPSEEAQQRISSEMRRQIDEDAIIAGVLKTTTLAEIAAAGRGPLPDGACPRCEIEQFYQGGCQDLRCPQKTPPDSMSNRSNITPFKSIRP